MTAIPGFDVHVLNPGRGKKGNNMAKRAGRKRSSKRRPRRRNPEDNPRGRRRRGRRSRRRNPVGRFAGGLTFQSATRDFWPRFLGKLWMVWVVRRFGDLAPTMGTGSLIPGAAATMSPFAGRSWTMGNYIVGYLGVWAAARMLSRGGSSAFATAFFHGGTDALFTKLVWTEAFARSPWLQAQFGRVGMGAFPWPMMMGQTQGDIRTDPQGQMWMFADGKWQAMQGYGQLEQAGPLDGLETASALDGLETASPLDGGMGHYIVDVAQRNKVQQAAYQQTGYTNPYQAAYA